MGAVRGYGDRLGLRRGDRRTGRLRPNGALSSPPIGLGFTPDDTTLLVASSGGEIAVLDLVGRQKLARPAETTGWIATFSPDGTRFAVPIDGSDNDTAIVDVATGKLLQTLHPARRFPNWGTPVTRPLPGRLQPGRTGGRDRFRRVRRPAGRDRGVLRGRRDVSPPPPRTRVCRSSGNHLRGVPMGGCSQAESTTEWFASTPRLVHFSRTLPSPTSTCRSNWQYDKDGKLAVGGGAFRRRGKAWVFDASGQPIRTYGSPTDPYWLPVWGPGGILILPNIATGEIRLVEPVADRQAGPSFTGPAGSAWVAVASDGHGGARGVVVGGDDMIQLWDVGTGQPIGEPIRASSSSRSFGGIMTNAESAVVRGPRPPPHDDLGPRPGGVAGSGVRGRRSQPHSRRVDEVPPRGRAVPRDLSAVSGRRVTAPSRLTIGRLQR